MVANIGRDELKAKIDQGDPFVLLEVLGPQYYRHSHLPGALNLPPGHVDEMAPRMSPEPFPPQRARTSTDPTSSENPYMNLPVLACVISPPIRWSSSGAFMISSFPPSHHR